MVEDPVLSFNGSKYDINLMKQYLHKLLADINETVSFGPGHCGRATDTSRFGLNRFNK